MSVAKILDLLTTSESKEKYKDAETWKILISLLKDETENTESTPKVVKDMFKPKYQVSFKSKDEFERLCNIIQFYSYVYVQRGDVKTSIRKKLIQILALYVIEGRSNKRARKKAETMFGIKTETVNSLNCALRGLGFLVRNPMRSGDDSLNPDLEALRKYYLSVGNEPFSFNISISL